MKRLEDGDIIAPFSHVASERQSSRTTTYYRYSFAISGCTLGQDHHPKLAFVIRSKALQITDSYRLVLHLMVDTLAFALLLLWANTAAYSGQGG